MFMLSKNIFLRWAEFILTTCLQPANFHFFSDFIVCSFHRTLWGMIGLRKTLLDSVFRWQNAFVRVKLKTLNSWRIPISISKTQIIRRLKFGVLIFFSREFFLSQYHVLYCLKINKKNFLSGEFNSAHRKQCGPFFCQCFKTGYVGFLAFSKLGGITVCFQKVEEDYQRFSGITQWLWTSNDNDELN